MLTKRSWDLLVVGYWHNTNRDIHSGLLRTVVNILTIFDRKLGWSYNGAGTKGQHTLDNTSWRIRSTAAVWRHHTTFPSRKSWLHICICFSRQVKICLIISLFAERQKLEQMYVYVYMCVVYVCGGKVVISLIFCLYVCMCAHLSKFTFQLQLFISMTHF